MTTWNILRHSIAQVFGNLAGALRVSAVLYAAQIIISLVTGVAKFQDQALASAVIANGTFPWRGYTISVLWQVICSVWLIVGWHRYVLLNEGAGVLPRFDARRIWAYMGTTILIVLCSIPALILGGIALVAGMVALQLAGSIPTNTFGQYPQVVGTFLMIPAFLVMFRLSILLPASAIGRPMTLSQVWAATKGRTAVFAQLAILSAAVGFANNFVASQLAAIGLAPLMAFNLVVGWLQLMIGISVITTLYGIYVEDRALVFS